MKCSYCQIEVKGYYISRDRLPACPRCKEEQDYEKKRQQAQSVQHRERFMQRFLRVG